MNIVGVILIIFGCTAAGIKKARSLSELDRTYSELISALSLIKSEISSRASPLDEVLHTVAGTADGAVGRFVICVRDDFPNLGEEPFCCIWSKAAESCLDGLSERALTAVKALGSSLGKYDGSMQCASLDRCISELSSEQKALREMLSANRRMYVGIGAASGLIIAIVLI